MAIYMLLLLVAFVTRTNTQGTGCEQGWTPYNGNCYWIQAPSVPSWNNARAMCQEMGGDLVIIDDQAENDFIRDLIPTTGMLGYWIGLTDTVNEGTFVWVDGRVARNAGRDVLYTNWQAGEPNGAGIEDCTQMTTENFFSNYFRGGWNDQPCTIEDNGYFCERREASASPCSSAPCLNGGECSFNRLGYTCNCVNRFTGSRCEIPPSVDTQPPTIFNCPNDIIRTVPSGQTSIAVSWIEPTATDDSGQVPNPIFTHAPNSVFDIGTTQVIYIFTDASNNRATCTFNVQLSGGGDTTPPNLNCPADQQGQGQETCIVTYPPATATDNSGGFVLLSYRPSGSSFPNGQTTVTVTGTDPNGNQGTCTFTVACSRVSSPCDSSPCQNGGQCFQSDSDPPEYFCVCPDGSVGLTCDIVASPVCSCGEDITRTIPLNVGGASIVFTECTAADSSGPLSMVSRSHTPGQRFSTGQLE
ncbi:hyalin-like isoform X2 [Amphiura filiformis]|uniref:hyalin-like isoform X2 n=1 Tax=Amphiura filiformis TaxID=82378 RepID=UPI003B2119D0